MINPPSSFVIFCAAFKLSHTLAFFVDWLISLPRLCFVLFACPDWAPFDEWSLLNNAVQTRSLLPSSSGQPSSARPPLCALNPVAFSRTPHFLLHTHLPMSVRQPKDSSLGDAQLLFFRFANFSGQPFFLKRATSPSTPHLFDDPTHTEDTLFDSSPM